MFESGYSVKDIITTIGISRETFRKYTVLHYGPQKKRALVLSNLPPRPSGASSPKWKGNKEITRAGYYRIYLGNGKRIMEHRMVMEEFLGRKLSRVESVHHLNGDKKDNRIENLVIVEPGEHTRLHNLRRTWLRNDKGQFKEIVKCQSP